MVAFLSSADSLNCNLRAAPNVVAKGRIVSREGRVTVANEQIHTTGGGLLLDRDELMDIADGANHLDLGLNSLRTIEREKIPDGVIRNSDDIQINLGSGGDPHQ